MAGFRCLPTQGNAQMNETSDNNPLKQDFSHFNADMLHTVL